MAVVSFRRLRQPVNTRPPAHPVDMYLARLMAGPSREGCRYVLNEIAPLLGGTSAMDVDWPALRYSDSVKMMAALAERELSIASRRKARHVLRGVLKECWRLGQILTEDYMRTIDIPNPRGDVLPAGRALSTDECAALWRGALADTSKNGRRDAAVLALLYATGMRRNELTHLRLEDYDRETGLVRIRHGKGNRQREAVVGDAEIRAVIDAWLTVRGEHAGYLLTAVINGRVRIRAAPMAGERIRWIVVELCRRAGIPACSPHDFRRTLASDLARRFSIIAVRDVLGHKHVTTTETYVRGVSPEAREAAASIKLPALAASGAAREAAAIPKTDAEASSQQDGGNRVATLVDDGVITEGDVWDYATRQAVRAGARETLSRDKA